VTPDLAVFTEGTPEIDALAPALQAYGLSRMEIL
jgi:hypothetical protein